MRPRPMASAVVSIRRSSSVFIVELIYDPRGVALCTRLKLQDIGRDMQSANLGRLMSMAIGAGIFVVSLDMAALAIVVALLTVIYSVV